MRLLKRTGTTHFGMIFITCDFSRNEYGQKRKYEKCRIRTAMRDEGLKISADHYLFFENLETGEARQCFKKLIRQVSFPPDYEWLQVKWFD